MSTEQKIIKALKEQGSAEKIKIFLRFFKTGKGEYGEGDRFIGVTVPAQRKIAREFYKESSLEIISSLLKSPFHEHRLTSLFILNLKFQEELKKGGGEDYVKLYLSHTRFVNNWDLVDSTAYIILGKWLEDKKREMLYKLAGSNSLWENRIAMVATLHFIRQSDLKDLFRLSKIFLTHSHDLMHKATGWMLREGWKRDAVAVESFLDQYATKMPRTMLRYAIEKMSPSKRANYLLMK